MTEQDDCEFWTDDEVAEAYVEGSMEFPGRAETTLRKWSACRDCEGQIFSVTLF